MATWTYAPPPGLPDLLHEDRDLLAVHKPSGLLSVPGRSADTADSAASRLQDARPPGNLPAVYPVHRLDMDTSGVLLFALRRKAEARLQQQFRARSVAKVYLARVWGRVREDTGLIDLPLSHTGSTPPTSRVDPEGKEACTAYTVLARDAVSSLLRLEPQTGRSHQLRVHLEALGHPILGDRFYGTEATRAAAPRLLLHAWRLAVDHPFTGARLHLEAPVPPELGA